MGFQGDSKVYQTGEKDHAIVLCGCASGWDHGGMEFRRSDDETDEYHAYVEMHRIPSYSFWDRLREAWSILLGRAVSVCCYWNRPTCLELAEWLIQEPVYQPKFDADAFVLKLREELALMKGMPLPEESERNPEEALASIKEMIQPETADGP